MNENNEQITYENEKKKPNIKFIISFILNIILAACLTITIINNKPTETEEDPTPVHDRTAVVDMSISQVDRFKKIYLENKEKAFVKDDYRGQIIFESEIISEPILQGITNDTYLRRNYETYEIEIAGPVFLDCDCDITKDQNTVLYGHNWGKSADPEQTIQFTPLHLLEKEENYEANKIIYLVLEDRVDVYQIVSVYDIKVEEIDGVQYLLENEPLYYLCNYSEREFNDYMKLVNAREKYDTGVEVSKDDGLLTLQTCYEGSTDKLIVLAKKIDSESYVTE